MLPRYGTLMQGEWNARETFEYRYDLNIEEGIFGCVAKLRQGLFMMGFAVDNVENVRGVDPDFSDWVNPVDVSVLLGLPRYGKKN